MTEYFDIALNDLVFSLCFLMFPEYLTLTSTTVTKTVCIALLISKIQNVRYFRYFNGKLNTRRPKYGPNFNKTGPTCEN